MKTNVLWKCLYCDRNLSAKRNVLMHISTVHKADGENPIMFSRVLVSPKYVSSLLKGSSITIEKNKDVENILSDKLVREDGCSDEQTGGKPEAPEVETGLSEMTVTETSSSDKQLGGEPVAPGNPVAPDKHKVKKSKAKKKKTKSDKPKQPCYDFSRLANVFSNPDLVEDLHLHGSSSSKQTKTRNINTYPEVEISSVNIQPPASVTIDPSQFPSPVVNILPNYYVSNVDAPDMPQVNTRHMFTVPYKIPRGKCSNWMVCAQCSILEDCGVCTNCLDKTLQ